MFCRRNPSIFSLSWPYGISEAHGSKALERQRYFNFSLLCCVWFRPCLFLSNFHILFNKFHWFKLCSMNNGSFFVKIQRFEIYVFDLSLSILYGFMCEIDFLFIFYFSFFIILYDDLFIWMKGSMFCFLFRLILFVRKLRIFWHIFR